MAVSGAGMVMLHVEFDKAAERARLGKEATRLETQIGKDRGSLGNPTFVGKAPAAVVEQMKARVADHEAKLADVRAQLAKLA